MVEISNTLSGVKTVSYLRASRLFTCGYIQLILLTRRCKVFYLLMLCHYNHWPGTALGLGYK